MVWTIAPIAGTPSYTCLGNSIIRNKLNELDSAELTCEGTFTCDTVVQIKEGATVLFQGYVKESKMEQNGKLYKLTLVETAQDLKYNIVSYLGSRSFIRTGLNVGQLVDLILTGSGWVKGTADATAVTALGFSNTTSSTAMYKLVKDMQGKYLWYTVTADGVTKQAWWGAYRTDRTGSPITTWISKQTESDSIDRNITKITVYGENSTIYGSSGSGTKEKVYKYSLAKTATECTDVATKLLADLGVNKARYVITLPKTNTYFAGDLVRVSSVNYTVHDVTRNQSNTVLGIGAAEVSYKETLGTNLEEIDGSIKSPSQKTYDGGEQETNATTGWVQNITIPDKNNMSDFKIKVRCKPFSTLTNVSATTEYLSEVSPVITRVNYSVNDNINNGSTAYYPYDGSNRYVKSGVLATGCQFALATININFRTNNTTGYQKAYIIVQYGYTTTGSPPGSYTPLDGSNYQAMITFPRAVPQSINDITQTYGNYKYASSSYMGSNTDGFYSDQSVSVDSYNSLTSGCVPVCISTLIPGTTTPNSTLYVRWSVYNYISGGSLINSDMNTAVLQTMNRHVHSLTTQYDKTPLAYTTTTFGVYVGGVLKYTKSAPVVQDTDYEVDITSYLATGDNNVEVRADAKCNISVTGSYYSV